MALIPKRNMVKEKMESGMIPQKHRPYIGMSSLGHPCQRKLWYDFHWAYEREISPRIDRLFRRGDYEEVVISRDFRLAGIKLFDQQAELVDETGHIKGHIDGKLSGVPGAEKTVHLNEVKTMNAKYFRMFMNKGLKISHPKYYVQMNIYMGEAGLSRCLFTVTNKDDEEREYKRFKYDQQIHDDYMRVGFAVLTAEFPPRKIGERTWFDCKFCEAKPVCHMGATISKNCRTCSKCDTEMDGVFYCREHRMNLSIERQRIGCSDYDLSKVFSES